MQWMLVEKIGLQTLRSWSSFLATVSPHSIRYSKKEEREQRTITRVPCANLAPLPSLTKKKYGTICFIALTQRLYWPLLVLDQIGDRFKAWRVRLRSTFLASRMEYDWRKDKIWFTGLALWSRSWDSPCLDGSYLFPFTQTRKDPADDLWKRGECQDWKVMYDGMT